MAYLSKLPLPQLLPEAQAVPGEGGEGGAVGGAVGGASQGVGGASGDVSLGVSSCPPFGLTCAGGRSTGKAGVGVAKAGVAIP